MCANARMAGYLVSLEAARSGYQQHPRGQVASWGTSSILGEQHPSRGPASLSGNTIILGDQCPSGDQHPSGEPTSSWGASIPLGDQHHPREPASHEGTIILGAPASSQGTRIPTGDQHPSPPAVQAPRHLSKPLNSHYFRLSLGKCSLGSQAESSTGSCAARC